MNQNFNENSRIPQSEFVRESGSKCKVKISAIIPTRGGDVKIAQNAIDSISWVDDILIADSSVVMSDMQKVKKCALKNKAKYVHREYRYSADFKNWAIPQAKHSWILLLDSDEVVTDKLKRYIQQLVISNELNKFDGFAIARKHFFFGKFLRYGGRYPLYNVRLFRKECRYEDRDVHAHILLKKNCLKNILPKEGDILHYSDRNAKQFFERFSRYSDYQARYIKKIAQEKIVIDWQQIFSSPGYTMAVVKDIWFFIPGAPLLRFFWMYIVKLGFLDGKAGLAIAMFYGFQDYVSKTKYYEILGRKNKYRHKLQNIFIYVVAMLFKERKDLIKAYNTIVK